MTKEGGIMEEGQGSSLNDKKGDEEEWMSISQKGTDKKKAKKKKK
jgi:hypothetical protein